MRCLLPAQTWRSTLAKPSCIKLPKDVPSLFEFWWLLELYTR